MTKTTAATYSRSELDAGRRMFAEIGDFFDLRVRHGRIVPHGGGIVLGRILRTWVVRTGQTDLPPIEGVSVGDPQWYRLAISRVQEVVTAEKAHSWRSTRRMFDMALAAWEWWKANEVPLLGVGEFSAIVDRRLTALDLNGGASYDDMTSVYETAGDANGQAAAPLPPIVGHGAGSANPAPVRWHASEPMYEALPALHMRVLAALLLAGADRAEAMQLAEEVHALEALEERA